MELTQTVSVLQDEVTLLKGEIKTVLKELRAALLSNDNPFSLDAPKFHSVDRPAEGSADAAGAEAPSPAQPSPPEAPAAAPPESQTPVPAPPPAAPGEPAGTAPIAGPEIPAPPAPVLGEVAGTPTAGPLAALPADKSAGHEPVPLRPSRRAEERAGEADTAVSLAPRWDLLTIASLAAWLEDALASLGTKRLRLVLDLACFAELISADVRDVLRDMAQVDPDQTGGDRPMNINECLVVLHQLEAILKGEKVSNQPRRRTSRRRRVR